MERLKAPFQRRLKSLYQEPAPELLALGKRIMAGEETSLKTSGKRKVILDYMGDRLRIRIPWGKNGLEKSFFARVDPETKKISVINEGFFPSDKHDWPEKTP